jgi:superfamily II RNA helicase
MVVICDKPYPSNSKYENHFELYPYPLSDFQKYAIESIVEGNHVLVTAHTGSGKTLPAEFAIQHFVKNGKKIIYTSPIKALSNQKYYEFTRKYPEISFGLFTGDIKTNPNADVLIMTTEILMNYLFTGLNQTSQSSPSIQESTSATSDTPSLLQFQMNIMTELACVVFDEVHYINDAERGQVWEKTILMLPRHVQMVMLSATIDNPTGFAEWCERGEVDDGGKTVYLASTSHRVVPLSHYGFVTTTESIFKSIKDKSIQQEIRDNTNKLVSLQDEHGKFNELGYKKIVKMNKYFDDNRIFMKRKHVLNQLSTFLYEREMLPAIAFVFSRKNVEACANDITVPLLEFDSKVPYTVRCECEQIIRKLPNFQEYLHLPEYQNLVSLLEKGVGIHHSGMIPVLREIVELMISKKYIKLLFATESFAIGLDCPIKTAIFTSVTKFDGRGERNLMSHEYTQMAGRAGRRGIDKVGHVIHCNNLFSTPSMGEYQKILGGVPQKLVSKYHISYSLILNLLKNGQTKDFHLFSQKSMIHREICNSMKGLQTELDARQLLIDTKEKYVTNARTPVDVCNQYIDQLAIYNTTSNKTRKQAEKEIAKLTEEYRYIKEDSKRVEELNELNRKYDHDALSLQSTEGFIIMQTDLICAVLESFGFVSLNTETNERSLTNMGTIASNIAEIHPLVICKLLEKWNYFNVFSKRQLVGLFSCFTDIKVQDDCRSSIPLTDDTFLKLRINELSQLYNDFAGYECEYNLNTGICYEDALQYDIIDLTMAWCDCQSVEECKWFIQTELAAKSISVGDFTKAMLKVVTIVKEWMNVFERIGNIEALHHFSGIDSMLLKYITTSQSLYV